MHGAIADLQKVDVAGDGSLGRAQPRGERASSSGNDIGSAHVCALYHFVVQPHEVWKATPRILAGLRVHGIWIGKGAARSDEAEITGQRRAPRGGGEVGGRLVVVRGCGKAGRRLGDWGHSGWGDWMLTDTWSYLWLGVGLFILSMVVVVPSVEAAGCVTSGVVVVAVSASGASGAGRPHGAPPPTRGVERRRLFIPIGVLRPDQSRFIPERSSHRQAN
jgi:hypothetical protein